jgi:tol-pal system protein YbgF
VQDVQANSGARLDTMSTQVQGLSDNLEEIKSRMGKLNQQLVDLQNTMQSVDAKISGGGGGQPPASTQPNQGSASNNGFPTTPAYSSSGSVSPGATNPAASSGPPPSGAPTADTLYSNGLRDITSGKYDLARSEFQDYLRYYGNTDLAGNAQFYLGEIAYSQKNYDLAVAEYDKVLTGYSHSFKVAPARLKKALANIELGQKATGVRELREIVKRYPGTEEDRRARAKLKEMGASLAASQ